MDFRKFERRSPSHQNAVDIFQDRWASNLDAICAGAVAGNGLHFCPEPALSHAARALGRDGRFDGMNILELGPLEGGQTYRLEQLGANVLAVEANAEAFLKCLIVKEIARMKARFMLGNFIPYLSETSDRYDLVFASGVLYHMEDPISVIQSIARVADRCFVFGATYDASRPKAPPVVEKRDPRFPNLPLFSIDYGETPNHPRFWGGVTPTSTWMSGDSLMEIFAAAGFTKIVSLDRPPTEANTVTCFAATK